jgi:hypothetical protein
MPGVLSPQRDSGSNITAAAYWTVLSAVTVLQVVPLFLIKYLPLVDLPNHEARIAVLAHFSTNPTMRAFYVTDWRPIPDLAFDLFGVPLVRLGLTPLDVGRLFLATAAVLYAVGGHLLARAAAGRRSWLGVVLPFLFYTSMLFYGFINFVFGFGVFLVAYGLWLRWRAEMSVARVAALSVLLVVAYLSHLAAFGLLGIAIGATIAIDQLLGRTARNAAARSLVAFLPSLVLLVYSAEVRGSSGGMSWGSIREKAQVLGGMFLTYDRALDALWLGGIIVVALVAFTLARGVAIEPSFAALATTFAFHYVLLPHSLITATNVDARVVPAAVAMTLCAVRLSLPPRVTAGLAMCVVVLAGSRVAVVASQWQTISDKSGTQVKLLDSALPENANLYSLFPEGGTQVSKRERPYAHLASYATIDRNAHVSRTFAERSQQPLVSRVDEIAAIDSVAPFTVNLATFRRYQYVWTYKPTSLVRRQLRGRCVAIYDSDGFYLCRRAARL